MNDLINTNVEDSTGFDVHSTVKEESSFPANVFKRVVFPDPGAPRTSVILATQEKYLITCYPGYCRNMPHV
jgi:S-adenosylmethionine hydrolase